MRAVYRQFFKPEASLILPMAQFIVMLIFNPAFAQHNQNTDAGTRMDLSLTIYNNDLAMVRDKRRIDLPKGRVRLEFAGVSAQIKPETSILNAAGVQVVEQNFDFDLLTPVKLLEKAVGGSVTLVHTNPATGAQIQEKAEVLSANDGVILKIGDRIEVLRADGLPTRVIFDHLPENLRPKPTLSMLLDADRGGERSAELMYLTNGLRWSADYVGRLDGKSGKLSIKGWITLTNNSGVDFENALTQVVAGDVHRIASEGYNDITISGSRRLNMMAKEGLAQQEALFDYHLYTLPERTTIAHNQTKQVAFLTAPDVQSTKAYRYQAHGLNTDEEPGKAKVHILFDNKKTNGLGQPLPKGIFRIYGDDHDQALQFLGEDRIDHSGEDARVDLHIGDAFDVTVQGKASSRNVLARLASGQTYEAEQSYIFRNSKDEAVRVEFTQNFHEDEFKVLEASLPFKNRSADEVHWWVDVAAKAEVELTFKVRVTQE